jgi:hypothetical protein
VIEEPSGPTLAADQARVAAQVTAAMQADQRRQAQAEAFQTASNTTRVPGVGDGGKKV